MKRGLMGFRQPDPKPKPYYNPEYFRARRKAFVDQGLTVHGTPRKRSWQSLKDLTPEQRKARLAKQRKESYRRRHAN